jgi:transglutaminase-like putative cysteine protease
MSTKAALATLSTFVALSVQALSALDLGFPAGATPYEPYMRPVKQVLGALDGNAPSMDRVKGLLKEGKSFRYSFTEPYVAANPSVTARTRSGDCKAKSLWLMNEIGDPSVRYVIGKARRTSKISHAWVMWNDGSRWWILDPTNTSKPIPADKTSRNEYIPLYSYDQKGCYRHAATQIFMANSKSAGKPQVAAEKTQR